MGFVRPVGRLGETWVRPHDIEVLEDETDGAIQAMIERVARVGFEVRVQAVLGDGTPLLILVTCDGADELELRAGQIVWLRVHRAREVRGMMAPCASPPRSTTPFAPASSSPPPSAATNRRGR